MNRFCILIIFIALLPACASYKTNSNKRFKSTDTRYERPIIYVGDLEQPPSEYSYIGTIDAEVRKPNPFASKPTEAMADIVLAELAQEQGAHAVTFVKYKRKITGGLEATGQAVRFKRKSVLDAISKKLELEREKANKTAVEVNFAEINSDAIEPFVDEPEAAVVPVSAPAVPAPIPTSPAAGEEPQLPASSVPSSTSLAASASTTQGVVIPSGEYTQVLKTLYQLRDQAKQQKDLARYQRLVDIIAKLEFFGSD